MSSSSEKQLHYFSFKNLINQLECKQSNSKCVVNTDRIRIALDSYNAKFQQLSNGHRGKDLELGNVRTTLCENSTKTDIDEVPSPNSFVKLTHNVDHSRDKCDVVVELEQFSEKNGNVDSLRCEKFSEGEKEASVGLNESRTRLSDRKVSCDRPYKCTDCEKSFKRNLHLKRHFMVSHTLKKSFSCNACGKLFSRKDYLDKHMGTHQRKNFKLKLLQQGIVVRTKMRVKTTTQN